MPEDIPEAPARLTEDEIAERACAWSDYRKDYGVSPDPAEARREWSLFCAGWDARHLSPMLTPAQRDTIDRVRQMIEANSHVTASITEALYTDAADRADADALARMTPAQRDLVAEARAALAEAADAPPEPLSDEAPGEGKMSPADAAAIDAVRGFGWTGESPEPPRPRTRREARHGHYVPPVVQARSMDANDLAARPTPGRPIPDNPQA